VKLSFVLKGIVDRLAQKNWEALQREWNSQPLLVAGLVFKEIEISVASTNFRFPHNLGYNPRDIIVTSATGLDGTPFTGTYSWNWDKFDGTNLDLTCSAPLKLRALVGTLS
jgi:hypothetical protein